ncbi:MAG: flagellin FliC5 [Eubacterium sp.]|jgi:flagellin|nr:flagellin FliC5 [Eubacterium sp.]
MSGIAGLGNSYTSYTDYGKLASGKRLQSAADGAAELAIANKINSQITGYDAGSRNIGSGKDMLQIADGALGGVTDYLQRIRELAVQASNSALMGPDDLNDIQQEINQMKQGIADLAGNTQYNARNVLDGSSSSLQIATNGNGSTISISGADATLQALGIADFDVTGSFDLQTIDNALEKVGGQRSSIGAKTNALDYLMNYNSNTSFNLTGAVSRLEDLDYPKAVSDQKKKEVLQLYSIMMQKREQENNANRMSLLWK